MRLLRRLQHTYPRAIRLAQHRHVDLQSLIATAFHSSGPNALALNAAYQDPVVKIVIDV